MFSLPPVTEEQLKTIYFRRRFVEVVDFAITVAYIVVAIIVGLVLLVGPVRYHNSKAVELVSGLGIPWSVIACIFFINAILLCHRLTRVVGWIFGAVLYGYYFLSAFTAIVIQGNTGSALAVASAFAAFLSQFSGLARSIVAAEWRKTG